MSEDILPPFGLGYIATHLKRNDIDIEIIDAVNEKISLTELDEKISIKRPRFIGINIFTTNYELVKKFVESLSIETHIIVGGMATKALYKRILKWETKNEIDIVIGDGELITHDIVTESFNRECFIEYPELKRRVFKIDRNSKYFIESISKLDVDRSLFINEPVLNIYEKNEVCIITSRGCIYDCAFCAAARSQNREFTVRERSEKSIINELVEIKNKYPEVESIRILDDIFLKSKDSIKMASKIFKDFNFEWRSMAHIRTFSNVSELDIIELKNSGCVELFIGIESGSPEILKRINKNVFPDRIISNLERLFKAGINVKGYFIFGFPEETEEDAEMTYSLALEIQKISIKYGVRFRTSVFQFRPYHGTRIFKELTHNKQIEENIEIHENKTLNEMIGREQFNFHGKNFSKISIETIHDYICKTNNISWDSKNQSHNHLKIRNKEEFVRRVDYI